MGKFFNKYCFELWSKYCLTVFSVFSTVMLFVPNIPDDKQYIKYIIMGILVFILLISYIFIYIYEIKSRTVKLKINNTEVNIFFGDIFDAKGKKVIAFNEYFDTQVDDIIIARKSLNGQVIDKKYIDKEVFDKLVEENNELIKGKMNSKRKGGKLQRYKLGQIQVCGDYFALAFTYFNDNNEAHLHSNEYANCLLEMWRQLNKYYAQNEVSIPLLGSGITRILDNTEVSNQELLEIMLQTLKISKMTFKVPSKINIVLYPGKENEEIKKYDLIRIKSIFRR